MRVYRFENVMHIRNAKSDDLNEIRELLSALDLPHGDLTPSHMKSFWVCRNANGKVVGAVGLEVYEQTALLRSLAVSPAFRNNGIGSRLANRTERHAHQAGVETLYLLTVTASNYFERRGYETIDRDELPKAIQQTEEAAQLCPSNAICMRKHVGVFPEKEAV